MINGTLSFSYGTSPLKFNYKYSHVLNLKKKKKKSIVASTYSEIIILC
jgi:hypothetical protein